MAIVNIICFAIISCIGFSGAFIGIPTIVRKQATFLATSPIIDAEVVKKVARLANFEMSEKDVEVLLPRIQEFMSFVDVIKDIDLDTTPTVSVNAGLDDAARQDVIVNFDNNDGIISNFPVEEDGYLYVPRVAADEP